MKAPSPFWPLFKYQVTRGYWGHFGLSVLFVLIGWFGCEAIIWLSLLRLAHHDLGALFEAGFLPIFAMMFICSLAASMAHATAPNFNGLLAPNPNDGRPAQDLGAFEFLFTRGLSRKTILRARLAAVAFYVLTPFLINVVVSPLAPGVAFFVPEPSPTSVVSVAVPPDLIHTIGKPGSEAHISSRGTTVFTEWLAWNAILAFVALQGYSVWSARWVKPHRLVTVIFPVAPLLLITLLMAVWLNFERTSYAVHWPTLSSLLAGSFMAFTWHPLVMTGALIVSAVIVQLWSERRFGQLEVL